jgi:hypothetical protein
MNLNQLPAPGEKNNKMVHDDAQAVAVARHCTPPAMRMPPSLERQLQTILVTPGRRGGK